MWWFEHLTGTDNGSGFWYLWWSGFFANATIYAGAFLVVRKHNCHVTGCKSVRTSNDPSVHAPACRRHHSLKHLHGIDPHA
jgi:hypothetical protein